MITLDIHEVVANKPRRALYPVALLLVEAQS